jgi:hypothetical protein
LESLTAFMLNALIDSSSPQNVSQSLARFLESGEPFPGWNEKQEVEKNNEGAEAREPRPKAPKRRPLPEDFALRGFPFVKKYTNPTRLSQRPAQGFHKWLLPAKASSVPFPYPVHSFVRMGIDVTWTAHLRTNELGDVAEPYRELHHEYLVCPCCRRLMYCLSS